MNEQEANLNDKAEEQPKPAAEPPLPPLGAGAPQVKRSPDVEPLGLDPHADDEEALPEDPEDIKKLDVCPNCAEPLRDINTLVCLRCGFDMKQNKVIKTKTGETTATETDSDGEEPKPLCPSGMGHRLLPLVLAVTGAGVMTIGYFAGAPGLFPSAAENFWDYLGGWVRFILFTGIWSACGLGALHVLAHIEKTKVGDHRLAAVRLLAVSCVASLVMFVDLTSPGWELVLEIVLLAGAFVLLSMLLFAMRIQAAAILAGSTLLLLLAIVGVSKLITWSAPGGGS